MSDLRALILDYGGVLGHPQPVDWYASMGADLGVGEETFRDAYWQHRHAYDSGLPVDQYWQRVHETIGRPYLPHRLDQLIRSDVASWTRYREEIWTIARSFRDRGGRTGFLSNSGPEMMARVRADRALDAWFDVVIVSAEVGLSKPDPRIYELALSRLGVGPAQALFVDDRADNVEAAARLGMRTLQLIDDDAVSVLHELVTTKTGGER
jgi:putative hydrolase of the HAD superfamily